MGICLAISWRDNYIHFVLDNHTKLDIYSASSLNINTLGHIILILSQPVFALSPKRYVLSGAATNTNSIVFGLTRLGFEPAIYCTRGGHVNYYYLSLPKSVPNAGDQLAPLYLALPCCLFGLTVFFRLLSVYRYIYGRTS